MTIIIQEIEKMNADSAKLYLSAMMKDITRVRIQIDSDRSGATELIKHDSEVIDTVIELLFDRIDGNKHDINRKLEKIKHISKNLDITAYHALGHDDGYVEDNLKSSMQEISLLNKQFIKFIRDRKDGDAKGLDQSKEKFIQSLQMYKDNKANFSINTRDTSSLELASVNKNNINDKDIISLHKLEIEHKKKGTMLPQILTTVTIATLASKLIGGTMNMFRNRNINKRNKNE